LAKYPDVRVELRLGDRLPDLASDGLDVSIVMTRRLADSGLLARKLAKARVVTCAAPGYLRRHGIPFRPQDLVHHQCLSHSVVQFEDWHFETNEGPVSLRASARITVDDRGFLRQAAIDGLGITMLPDPLVAADLAAGRLLPILEGFQNIELAVNAVHPHGRNPPASVRAFLDHLAAAFRQPPWLRAARESSAPPPTAAAAKKRKHAAVAITDQDAQRLQLVAKLYEAVDEPGAARLHDVLGRVRTYRPAKMPRSAVTMNSRLICRDDSGREQPFTLVYPWETGDNRLSVLSASGCALLGASVGSSFEHAGQRFVIASLDYQPEAAGDQHL
jgi:transcription elongation GreA/GreB family factor